MGRYPKKRGNGWTHRKSGNTNGSTINRKRSNDRKNEYKNKYKIKTKIIKKINIPNIQKIQQQNNNLSKENEHLWNTIDKLGDNTFNLKQQIMDLENNDNDNDLYKYINEDIKNEKKFDILYLLSLISPKQLTDILPMIDTNISSEIPSLTTLKIWRKIYLQIFSHVLGNVCIVYHKNDYFLVLCFGCLLFAICFIFLFKQSLSTIRMY